MIRLFQKRARREGRPAATRDRVLDEDEYGFQL